jgi:RNA polymerase sigma-70 factor, ECF subfamily
MEDLHDRAPDGELLPGRRVRRVLLMGEVRSCRPARYVNQGCASACTGEALLPRWHQQAGPLVTTSSIIRPRRPTFRPASGSYEETVQGDDVLVRIARRAVAGDRDALDELLRELEPLVVRAVRLIVGSGSWTAEDAAQDALLDVARGIGGLRAPEAVKTWALRVATTRAIKAARRDRLLSLRRAPQLAEQLAVEPADERAAALKEAFDRLPPKLRATAVLRLYVGLSEAETAEVLGCSLGTVKSNLHDARKRLASSLGDGGSAPRASNPCMEETV